MPDTFPDIPPSYNSQGSVDIRTLTATFGDGYTQDAGDGLNNIRDSWDLAWEDYPIDLITQIDEFLRLQAGTAAFYWTPPDETEPKKWKCKGWKKTPKGFETRTLRAVFVQAFDL